MKYIKTYEIYISDNIHIGDYILVHYKDTTTFGSNSKNNEVIINYLNNNIAQISSFDTGTPNIKDEYIIVKYETPPDKNILKFFQTRYNKKLNKKFYDKIINKKYIIAVSKNKEELETKIQTIKYNL